MASRESSPWSARVLSRVTPEYHNKHTILIGGPEVVLDSLNHIGLNILLFLEYELGAVDELALLVVGQISSWPWSSTGFGDFFGEGEAGEGFD